MSLQEIVGIVQGGGNLALLVCVYYMYKLNDRLARMETVIGILAHNSGVNGGATLAPKEKDSRA